MMLGYVNANREAIVQFAVLGENQTRLGIKAVIDTGYTGCLTLPPNLIWGSIYYSTAVGVNK
jgi:predicted aspartyl protease